MLKICSVSRASDVYMSVFCFRLDYDHDECDHLIDQDLEAALKALEGGEQVESCEHILISYRSAYRNVASLKYGCVALCFCPLKSARLYRH